MRLTRTVLVAVACLALVAGCSDGGGDPEETTPVLPPAGPGGDAVVIEPLASLPGAERTTLSGVGIDVPEQMTVDTSTTPDGMEILALRREGEERAAVTVTISPQEGAGPALVDVSSSQTEAELAVNTAVENLQRRPVTWDGLPYAVLTTLDITVDEATGEVHEIALVTTHDPAGTMVVGVSAEAPKGELESSDAWDALRTLRFEG